MRFYLLIIVLLLFVAGAYAQPAAGGQPESFNNNRLSNYFQEMVLPAPNLQKFSDADFEDKFSLPHPFEELIPVELSLDNSGTWEQTDAANSVWRLMIRSEGALALSLYFSGFFLPERAELFVYDDSKQQLIGAFTNQNNPESGFYATDMIIGESIILELNIANDLKSQVLLQISDVGYAFRSIPQYANGKGFGSSDFCEINVRCSPEGDNWQKEKNGIVRIKARVGGQAYWCSGSLINNTSLDYTPYILTADHCAFKFGSYATIQNLNQWMFYFDYESPTCDNPEQEPTYNTFVGAVKIAHGGNQGQTGSDFFLVLLNESIQSDKGVYFNGWSAIDLTSSDGVTIHHPEGDIKKISTYTIAPETYDFLNNGILSHWEVYWSETQNNWAVTEPGSSGSPLFDNNRRIIGTLSAGYAACETSGNFGPDRPDYYGKFSFHWESNGTDDTLQLKPWLDPGNTGITSLGGLTLDVAENFTTFVMEVYPNPFNDYLTFEPDIRFMGIFEVYVMDVFGKVLLEKEFQSYQQQLTIQLEDLVPGVYFLAIKNNKTQIVKKIVKK
jgi:hypothetical protein